MNYFFNPKARIEYLEQISYYESQQAGLGARFLKAFDLAMGKVCQTPLRFKIAHPPDIRCYRLPSFPYTILYRLAEDEVEVLAVAAHRRKPQYWHQRM